MKPNAPPVRWKRTDATDDLKYCPHHEQFSLIYAREYAIGRGFSYSETNSLISNLKASPLSTNRKHYKQQAIEHFARELVQLIGETELILIPNPPSKTAIHPEYDDRIVQVARKVETACEGVEVAELLRRSRDAKAASSGGGRTVEKRKSTLQVDADLARELSKRSRAVFLLDDMLTSGSSFEAARQLLEPYGLDVFGLFWARAKDI